MSRRRSQYYNISETLQAVLDQCSVDDEHLWDDEVLCESQTEFTCTPSTSVASLLPPLPSIPAPLSSNAPTPFIPSLSLPEEFDLPNPPNAESLSLACSSTPKSTCSAMLLPSPSKGPALLPQPLCKLL